MWKANHWSLSCENHGFSMLFSHPCYPRALRITNHHHIITSSPRWGRAPVWPERAAVAAAPGLAWVKVSLLWWFTKDFLPWKMWICHGSCIKNIQKLGFYKILPSLIKIFGGRLIGLSRDIYKTNLIQGGASNSKRSWCRLTVIKSL